MVTQTIYNFIKYEIASMQYVPGTTFSDCDLARSLGASTDTVRQAFTLLAHDKLIHLTPRHEAIVAKLDLHTTQEAIFILQSLLVAIIGDSSFILNDRETGIFPLRKQLFLFENNNKFSPLDFFNMDDQFYLVLCSAKGSQKITKLIFAEKLHIEKVLRLILRTQADCRPIINHYVNILHGIQSHQPGMAAAAIYSLTRTFEASLAKAESSYPGFFKKA